MKHLTMEESIDFVNQAVPTGQKTAMERHLKICQRCANTVSQWQRVRAAAAAEANYQPPEEVIRIVKAAFAGLKLALQHEPTSSSIELVFDSLVQPSLEGFRSAGSPTRQMVYRADPFQIDLQIEVQPGNKRVVVAGQLLSPRDPQRGGQNVRLILANLHGVVVPSVTNQFGEFRAEIENTGDLALVFYGTDLKPVVIPLWDALGRSPEGKAKQTRR
jgi:hypothetical protein